MCARQSATARALSLGWSRSTRACGVREPRCAGWRRFTALGKPTAPARWPSPSLHGRAPTCQPGPPTSIRRSRVRTRERATTRSLSGGGTARALAVCARRAVLVVVGPRPMKARCASETALSLVAQPCSDVPTAATNEQPTFARVCAHANAPPRVLSREEAQHARLRHPHATPHWLASVYFPTEAHCASETALSLAARPCSDVPAGASNEHPAFACAHTRTRHHALSLGRRHSTRACGVRAPRRAGCSRFTPDRSPLRQRDGPLPPCTAAL